MIQDGWDPKTFEPIYYEEADTEYEKRHGKDYEYPGKGDHYGTISDPHISEYSDKYDEPVRHSVSVVSDAEYDTDNNVYDTWKFKTPENKEPPPPPEDLGSEDFDVEAEMKKYKAY
jgi:hypothetical protein